MLTGLKDLLEVADLIYDYNNKIDYAEKIFV